MRRLMCVYIVYDLTLPYNAYHGKCNKMFSKYSIHPIELHFRLNKKIECNDDDYDKRNDWTVWHALWILANGRAQIHSATIYNLHKRVKCWFHYV